MSRETKVVGPYAAIIDGESTGLAGCGSTDCPRSNCLRKDPQLANREPFKAEGCRYFIPAN